MAKQVKQELRLGSSLSSSFIGSGKTYSMLGQGWEEISPNDSQQSERIIQESDGFGLIPRCIAELFDWIQKRSADESFDYSISMSLPPPPLLLFFPHILSCLSLPLTGCQYIQIYNEVCLSFSSPLLSFRSPLTCTRIENL